MHQGQFLKPDSQIRTILFFNTWLIMKFNRKDAEWWFCVRTKSKCAKIVSSEIALEVLKSCRNIFGHFRQHLGILRKLTEIFRLRWRHVFEIPVMTRRKSHTFDSGKVLAGIHWYNRAVAIIAVLTVLIINTVKLPLYSTHEIIKGKSL